ncbi:membrane protein : MscS Mechanosensitive ion channel OS=Chondromyces apiculatus DSM 436 GN=CAP_3804 PE=4 SV=1: MS_channel [Gemmata massiliana]|uniref:Mechanosensitive ion channel MscS domain-containing protein n=1 Tax=Gemmata massiliana TaxID=1210884 RepID=A0A6P2DJP7_9BACT|nr:mechanosensitive ion channel domain-containing protein [Gemmata massiliana]VTS00680.1 membrane protein : MscS Mechanosensitive ion channel OS=Chondromyces apiculatus DSM 436 GN=CAP_3804 PE=4 SV=1: MS_channel [Gemmata massiliana]
MLDRFAAWLSDPSNVWLGGPAFLGVTTGQWVALALFAATGWVLGRLSGYPARSALQRVQRRVPSVVWAEGLEDRLTAPIALLVTVAVLRAGCELLELSHGAGSGVRLACNIVLISVATLLVVRLVGVAKEYLQAVLVGRTTDPGRIRSIATRVTVPARILQFLLWIAGIALALLQFQAVREVGVSLLASAGVAGVVLGLAAQRTVGNVLAGLQLAFAEPVRIGDTVVVEGEFGVVEEINLTNVVVKVWDLHRLVLPVSYFVEKPFQNWSRGSTEMMGAVMLQADFSVPVPELRAELGRVLAATDLWDGKTSNLQVTELSGGRVELRALVSASDSGRLWDLRCHVREQLLTWLQSRGQRHLPVQRIESIGGNGNGHYPPGTNGPKT